jgi:hypothetical protein
MAVHDAMFGTSSRLIRSCLAGLCLSPCFFSNSPASVDVCQQPSAFSHLSIAYYDYEKSYFEQGFGEAKREKTNSDLLFRLSDNWSVGAGHRYTILEIEPLESQTNGHLHTFFVPLHRESQSDRKTFRLSIAPALSASSNVMKNPNEYNADAFQLIAALVWSRQPSDRAIVRYGVCGDHRFGNYEIYLSVSVELQPDADWTIELGFPTSQLTYQVSKSLISSLRITPDGNKWYVMDKALERQSKLVYKAWLFEWTVGWLVHEHFMVKASVGRQFDNENNMTLLNEDRVTFRTDPVTRLGVALTWRF